MDGRCFDAVAQTIGRRGVLRAALAFQAGALPTRRAAAQTTACNLKQKGERCRDDDACCSGRCKIADGRKKGHCRCSKLGQPCFDNFDCCGDITGLEGSIVCSDKTGFSEIVCCVSSTGDCETSADCCSSLVCRDKECVSP